MPATPKGAPFPAATSANDVPADIQALATWTDARPGVSPLTTAARDALTGADLWDGRVIYNLTTAQLERYNATLATPAWQPAATSDHGLLTGLGDDDHPQYLLHTEGDAAYVPKTLVDAKGDLLLGSAADTVARLAPGADGQVLKANAAAALGVEWGAAAAGLTTQGFRAHRSVAQAIAASTVTKVIFDTEVFDEAANYDPVTGLFTAPAAGWYDIAASIVFATTADQSQYQTLLFVNGIRHTDLAGAQGSGTTSLILGGARPIRLAAADTVGVYVFRGNAGDVGALESGTYFTATRRF